MRDGVGLAPTIRVSENAREDETFKDAEVLPAKLNDQDPRLCFDN